MKTVIILCPSHDINDKRINRITKVLSRRYNTKSFYEESYRLNDIEGKKNIFYLKSKLSYFRIKSILKNHNVSSQFSLYIHDPGFFGLILCELRKVYHLCYSFYQKICAHRVIQSKMRLTLFSDTIISYFFFQFFFRNKGVGQRF